MIKRPNRDELVSVMRGLSNDMACAIHGVRADWDLSPDYPEENYPPSLKNALALLKREDEANKEVTSDDRQ